MVEIKPGPELDKAVAEAADPWCSVGMCASSGCIDIPPSESGDTAATDPDVLALWKWDGERNWRTLPKFSTDLNAAFAAAEKVGGDTGVVHLTRVVGGDYAEDYIADIAIPRRGGGLLAAISENAPTPALAICAAILKLKGDKDDRTL